jgi:hypothetical protein
MIETYPFGKTYTYSVKTLNDSDLNEDKKHTLIAWRCLQTKNKDELKLAYNILLP